MLHDELEVIKLIKRSLGKPSSRVLMGIGDDAAVAKPPRGQLVVTTDSLVENVHFDLTYTNAEELGHKSLAVNLSDMAAMGAEPLYALVSIGLRQETSHYFIEKLYQGVKQLAKRFNVDIIGGNTVQSPTALVVDVVLIGETKKAILRSRAKSSDLICVTGKLGDSAAGLNLLKRIGRNQIPETWKELVKAHLTPHPRVKEMMSMKKFVNAAIDLSDGLSTDLHHLAHASHVGAVIDSKKIPISEFSRKAAEHLNASAEKWALCGGEDYEMLLTVPQKNYDRCCKIAAKFQTTLTNIGEVVPYPAGVKLIGKDGKLTQLEPLGWNHFVRRGKLRSDPE